MTVIKQLRVADIKLTYFQKHPPIKLATIQDYEILASRLQIKAKFIEVHANHLFVVSPDYKKTRFFAFTEIIEDYKAAGLICTYIYGR